jgi:hypothetical protein
MTAAVTESERPLPYRRPSQKAGGGDVGGRYRKWPLQKAVTGSGRCRRPLQEVGGGDGNGRYISDIEQVWAPLCT